MSRPIITIAIILAVLVLISCATQQAYEPPYGSNEWVMKQHQKNLSKQSKEYNEWVDYAQKSGMIKKSPKKLDYGTEEYRSWDEIEYNAYEYQWKKDEWASKHSWETPALKAMNESRGLDLITWDQWKAGKRPKYTTWSGSGKKFRPTGTIMSCTTHGCVPVIHCTSYGCKALK